MSLSHDRDRQRQAEARPLGGRGAERSKPGPTVKKTALVSIPVVIRVSRGRVLGIGGKGDARAPVGGWASGNSPASNRITI
jgi:hypothetical protein